MSAPPCLAVLVIAHANPATFRRLADALRHPAIRVFVHIDRRADEAPFRGPGQKHVTFLTDRVANLWGAFTQIEVTLALIRAARAAGPFTSYALVSGDTLPLCDNDSLLAALGGSPTAFRARLQTPQDKAYERVARIFLPESQIGRIRDLANHRERFLAEDDLPQIERALRMREMKRNLPFPIHKGSQWLALSDRHVGLVLDHIARHPDYVELFRYSLIPDELFFHTAVPLLDPGFRSPGGIVAVDFTRKPRPWIWRDPAELEQVLALDALFCRKFADTGAELADRVLARRHTLADAWRRRAGVVWRYMRGEGAGAAEPADEAED